MRCGAEQANWRIGGTGESKRLNVMNIAVNNVVVKKTWMCIIAKPGKMAVTTRWKIYKLCANAVTVKPIPMEEERTDE